MLHLGKFESYVSPILMYTLQLLFVIKLKRCGVYHASQRDLKHEYFPVGYWYMLPQPQAFKNLS